MEEALWSAALWGIGWLTKLVRLGRVIRRLEEAAAIARAVRDVRVITTAILAERRIRRLETEEELLAVLRRFMTGENAEGRVLGALDGIRRTKAKDVIRIEPGDILVRWMNPDDLGIGSWVALLEHDPRRLGILLRDELGRERRLEAFVATRRFEALATTAEDLPKRVGPLIGGRGGELQITIPDDAKVGMLNLGPVSRD